jgi:hypothetical protein
LGRVCAVAAAAIAGGLIPNAANAAASFTFYGFAQLDAIYDFNRVDPAWDDTLRPSKIPTTEGIFGSDGQAIFSGKQSRFGVKGDIPTAAGYPDITFKFEFDAYGVGVDAGQTTIRFRHMYGEWGWLLAGQTNSVFMDIDVFPNVIDYWGPNGMVFLRNPQIRVTPWRTEDSSFAIALEKPGNDIDVGLIREFDPGLGASIQNDEKLPDLTAHFYTKGTWGHFQIAAILRDVGYDTKGTVNNEPKSSQLGWGVDLTGHLNVFEKDRLIAGVVYGQGIASYMNDGGMDLAPGGTPADPHAKAVPLFGALGYYEHRWNDKLSTALGYSITQVDNTTLQAGTAYYKGEYASMNLLYTPVPSLLIGGELLWGRRQDNSGASGEDIRFQFSVKYDFSATVNI